MWRLKKFVNGWRRLIVCLFIFGGLYCFHVTIENFGRNAIIRLILTYDIEPVDKFTTEFPQSAQFQSLDYEGSRKCKAFPKSLKGQVVYDFNKSPWSMSKIRNDNSQLQSGGVYIPTECDARWKVAIIIPYRNRLNHLQYFLQYMHPILQRQQLHYRIYIINQFGSGLFNRAKLLNVGFVESLKDEDFDCFVFHDVDHILTNDYAMYSCPKTPRHLSHIVDKYDNKLPYPQMFGGVSQLTKSQFLKINGFPNTYWGWGGEDDDIYRRIASDWTRIRRYPEDIAVYQAIPHERDIGNEDNEVRKLQITKTVHNMDRDGINTLKYKVVKRTNSMLYTNITVDIV